MWKGAVVALLALAALMPGVSFAAADAANAAADAAPAPAQQTLGNAALDPPVAPIALYPDALVTQVLMAATYPLEVVQAARWVKANKSLKGDKLDNALAKQDWDASVKALAATPTVLAMMNDDLD